MGFATTTARIIQLEAQSQELQYKMQVTADALADLSRTMTDLMNVGTDLDPDSPVVKKLKQRKERLYLIEKKLNMQMEQYKIRLKAIDIERQSCEQMLQKNVQKAFSYGG